MKFNIVVVPLSCDSWQRIGKNDTNSTTLRTPSNNLSRLKFAKHLIPRPQFTSLAKYTKFSIFLDHFPPDLSSICFPLVNVTSISIHSFFLLSPVVRPAIPFALRRTKLAVAKFEITSIRPIRKKIIIIVRIKSFENRKRKNRLSQNAVRLQTQFGQFKFLTCRKTKGNSREYVTGTWKRALGKV